MKKTERTIEQIIAAVKAAARTDIPAVQGRAAHEPAAIRLPSGRFVLVRDVLDIQNGVLPGRTNIYFHAAVDSALAFGIITKEESTRFFDWYFSERARVEQQKELALLEGTAERLGFRLVKPGKRRKKR